MYKEVKQQLTLLHLVAHKISGDWRMILEIC